MARPHRLLTQQQAGATAASAVDMMLYPLDTLKTRQQSQDFLKTFVDPSTKTRLPSRQLFRGLYQGIGIVVVATLPAAVRRFHAYDMLVFLPFAAPKTKRAISSEKCTNS